LTKAWPVCQRIRHSGARGEIKLNSFRKTAEKGTRQSQGRGKTAEKEGSQQSQGRGNKPKKESPPSRGPACKPRPLSACFRRSWRARRQRSNVWQRQRPLRAARSASRGRGSARLGARRLRVFFNPLRAARPGTDDRKSHRLGAWRRLGRFAGSLRLAGPLQQVSQ